jgi:mycothiol synthase
LSLEVRAPREDEAPALARLLEEHALAAFGESELSDDEVRHWFTLPGIWIRVAERDGRIVGYADVVARDETARLEVDIRTLDREAAEALLVAAEQHGRHRVAAGAVLRGVAQGADPVLPDAFGAAGWGPIRHSYQMRIELSEDRPEPRWPDGISVRTFRAGEEERVYEAQMDAFADDWDFRRQPLEQWRAFGVEHPRFDPSLWWLAEDGDELAGVALNAWHFSGDPAFGWIAVLGVRRPWRRRGLATALLQHSFRDFRSRGAMRVGLGVDAENTTGAVRLYERAGMQAVRRNDTYGKVL